MSKVIERSGYNVAAQLQNAYRRGGMTSMERRSRKVVQYTVKEVEGVICVHVDEDIVAENAISQFGDSLDLLVLESEDPKVVVDFAAVDFLPTAMLGNLIAANTKMINKGAKLGVSGASEQVRSIFEVTRLDQLFQFFDHIDDAIKGLQ